MPDEKKTMRLTIDGVPLSMRRAVEEIAEARGVRPSVIWREALYESPVFAGKSIKRVPVKLGGARPGAGNKPGNRARHG